MWSSRSNVNLKLQTWRQRTSHVISWRSRFEGNREVKHDVYGKRQKWNFCRLSSAHCTVESNYLYLQWMVRDTFLFVYDLYKDYKKRIENQS